jgi:predicted DNA-binding protein with PD1-like motif
MYKSHIALGGKTSAVRGAHLKEAAVSVTCEITLTRFRDDIGRKKDAATGLLKLALEPGGD